MKLITALIQPEKFDDIRLIPKDSSGNPGGC